MAKKILYDELILYDILYEINNQKKEVMIKKTCENIDINYNTFIKYINFLKKYKFLYTKRFKFNGKSTSLHLTFKGKKLFKILKELYQLVYNDSYKKEIICKNNNIIKLIEKT